MIVKTDKKYHIEWREFTEDGHNGQGNTLLSEPVPNFLKRPGDKTIYAEQDNNTVIILGRDRDPFRETKDGKKEKMGKDVLNIETVSGYSDHMGAGAIDMIVGRGAPYPLKGVKNYPNFLPPLYLTKELKDVLKPKEPSTSGDPDDDISITLRDGQPHPGYIMDAARIYISQMCDVDDYFALHHPPKIKIDQGPSSAIVLKADRIRLHSRRDIKIVAGGDKATEYDSNGFRIREDAGRIHLISGNGKYFSGQQPIPVGYHLVTCFEQTLQAMTSTLTLLHNFMKQQKSLNACFANHRHVAGTGVTTRDPVAPQYNQIASVSLTQDMNQCKNILENNIVAIRNNFLKNSGPLYINSRYNTTT